MSESAPHTPKDIRQRELAGVEIIETNPRREQFLVRASAEEAIELIRRLIEVHYKGYPLLAEEQSGQLDGLERQLRTELSDYGVFLYDEPQGSDPLRSGWMIDAADRGQGFTRIVFTRTGHIREVPDAVGRKVIEKMQDAILSAMEER